MTEGPGRTGKVEQAIAEYALDGLGEELVERWETDETSVRDLAAEFNREVLGAALTEAGRDPLAGEVANLYRLLTDDEVSTGVRTETRLTLENEGVDVEALRDRFVSHQAMYRYLKERQGAEKRGRAPASTGEVRDRLERLQGRTERVTESQLARLGDGDALSLGEFDVLVDVRVLCKDCGTDRPVGDLLGEGGCRCE